MKSQRTSILSFLFTATAATLLAQAPDLGAPPVPPPNQPPQMERRDLRQDRRRAAAENADPAPEPPRAEAEHGRRDQPARWAAKPIATAPTPYLGVVTAPLGPVLASQLSIPEGFGLAIEDVLPNSPAAAGGLQKNDVLKLFNDQQLVYPYQLAMLVRAAGKDTDATLTIVRKGQEQKISVKIGERLMPQPLADRPTLNLHLNLPADTQDRLREMHTRIEELRRAPLPRLPQLPPVPPFTPPGDQRPMPEDVLREVPPGGAPHVITNEARSQTTWNTGHARASVKDKSGEVELRSEDGHRTVIAKNPAGETTFTGPADTAEQRAQIPAEVREKLEQLHATSGIESKGAAAAPSRNPKLEAERPREDNVQ